MKHTNLPRIQLHEKHLPPHWQERLVADQMIGGVFLVFLRGKNASELRLKAHVLKKYCKTIDVVLKTFATVQEPKYLASKKGEKQ